MITFKPSSLIFHQPRTSLWIAFAAPAYAIPDIGSKVQHSIQLCFTARSEMDVVEESPSSKGKGLTRDGEENASVCFDSESTDQESVQAAEPSSRSQTSDLPARSGIRVSLACVPVGYSRSFG